MAKQIRKCKQGANGDLNPRVVTWYMGSGLKAQNMTGIRAQRKGLRAQKNRIRDHKVFEPESAVFRQWLNLQ